MSELFTAPLFLVDKLSGFVMLAVALFFVLTVSYSLKFMRGKARPFQYYGCLFLTFLAALGVVASDNLIFLLACWGFLGLMLYLLILMGDEKAYLAARKTLVIVGGSDALMMLGIGMIFYYSRSLDIHSIRLEFSNIPLVCAYLCCAVGCFAKAGAMPFHSWIPDCAESAPVPVTAYLPASLDKLLGIYFLARLSLGMFVMNNAMNAFLMCVGAFTILAAVMMALIQHNMKRLLGYHAVSQVGYMVLGLGTGNAIGIAGGIFHMLNHAVYKSCLFFSAGNVEYRTNTSELDRLGGLSKAMPLTYFSTLIASLSISGIPPFNGFVSKWLIYQGLVLRISQKASSMQALIPAICLACALFGSALTLASFIKLLHAVFLGQRLETERSRSIREVSPLMWVPCVVLALICILFGVLAFALPLKYVIFPAVSQYLPFDNTAFSGSLPATLAALFVAAALLCGIIIYRLSMHKAVIRRDESFSGGELKPAQEESMVTGVDFYSTVKEIGFLSRTYQKAEAGTFDIFEQGKKFFGLSKFLQFLHNGVLPTYLVWVLLGIVGLLVVAAR